jgi:hypothetical protein
MLELINYDFVFNVDIAAYPGEEVALWRLTLLSHWSKAKFKSPCNFEEFLCRPHIFAL